MVDQACQEHHFYAILSMYAVPSLYMHQKRAAYLGQPRSTLVAVDRFPQNRARLIGSDGPLPLANGGYPRLRYSDFLGQAVLADPHRDQKLLFQYFARMYVWYFWHNFTSMIIANFDTRGYALGPDKTDSPLGINSDAPLTFAVPGKFLQPILRRYSKIFYFVSIVQHP
jgi:hypothetical protein